MILASFFGDLGNFFSSLGDVHLLPLLLGMVLFIGYLSLRALAFRNILQDAYPSTPIPTRRIWGAYMAAYGFNNVIPARGGDVLKVYLTKTSIPGSSYPTIGAALLVEAIFDLCAGGLAVVFAIAMGVFPQPPSWVSLDAVDLSFVAADGRRSLFLLTAIVIGVLVLFSLVALRVRMFWARVRQGFAVLRDRRRYLKRVWGIQGIGWLVRCGAFLCFLRAFGIPATVENALLVLSANAVAAVFPFTPGGAGVVQALLLELLRGAATGAAIAAYGVGVQATIGILSFAVGFLALVAIFEVRSFREVIARGKADRQAEREAERAAREGAAAVDVSAAAATAGGSPRAPGRRDPPARGRASTDAGGAGPVDEPGGAWLDEEDDPTLARPASPEPGDDGSWLDEELAPDQTASSCQSRRSRWRRRERRD